MIPHLDPRKYAKLFFVKQTLFTSYYEITERHRVHQLEGLPDIDILYLDGQWHYLLSDLERYRLAPPEIERVIDEIVRRGEGFVSFAATTAGLEGWPSLRKTFQQFMTLWGAFFRIVDIPVYYAYHFEQDAAEAFGRAGLSFDDLSHPLSPTFHQRRFLDLLDLKEKKLTRAAFKERWAWSRMDLFSYRALDDTFIDEQLAAIEDAAAERDVLSRKSGEAKERHKTTYDRLSPELQALVDRLQRLLWIRDYRYELAIRGAYAMQPYTRRLASHFGISVEEINFCLPDEILSESIPPNPLQRKRHVFYDRLYTGKDVDVWHALFNRPKRTGTVVGKGVSSGAVKGTARVVASSAELSKVRQGDILVCEMTTPDYFSALKKVGAIVAEIGGFTSHAAIVAREFSIPCVVGAADATRIFSDGEEIIVDATKGEVRRA